MKKLSILIILVALFVPHFSFATDAEFGGGIVYAPSAAFTIIAPEGWTLDAESGRRYGFPAVLYPKGSSFDGPLVMYINSAEKKRQKANNINEFVEEEIARFKSKHPDITITDSKPLPIANGNRTIVKEFVGDSWGNFEAVAYFEEEKTYISFTLSSKTKEEYKKNFKAFEALVASYGFITNDVR